MEGITWIKKTFSALSLSELYDIMYLRQLVFVVEQNCPYIDADYKDLKGWHVLGYSENILMAYARLLPKGISYSNEPSIGRVVNHPDYRHKGIGKALMKESLQLLEDVYKTKACRISAQTYLVKFYEYFWLCNL